MRFLLDAHHLGMRTTGSETWTRNVVSAMQRVDAAGEVDYAVTALGVEELRSVTRTQVHVVSTSSLRRLTVDVPRIARTIPADAVFTTYTAPLTRRPAVVVVHDVSAWNPQAADWLPMRERAQYRITVGASCRFAAHVLAPSEFTRRDLIERLGVAPDRVSVAAAAVDHGLQDLLTATPRPVADQTLRVLAVGNVLPRKNLLVLAEGVRACRQKGVDVRLRIVGSVPPEGRTIASTVRRLLGEHAHITGYVSLEELAVEYRSADVLGFPSLLEGFGFPVVEAMAAGTPVIVSSSGSLPEVAGGAALVCDPGDVGAWRDALLRIWDDSGLRDQLRERGLVRCVEFSWSDVATVVLDRLRAAARDGST